MNLPDVNVLLAMCSNRHAHYSTAVDWHRQAQVQGELWGMCRLTSLALLRMLTNTAVMGPDSLPSAGAWSVIERLEADPLYRFIEEPAACWSQFRIFTRSMEEGHRYWTDAYLSALAMTSNCRFITFDRTFTRWPGLRCSVLGS